MLNLRWGGRSGRIELVNGTRRTQKVSLEMTIVANNGGNVTIQTPLLSEPVNVDRHAQKVHRTLTLPPGSHPVLFASDAPRAYPPDDFRDLVFSVQNLTLTPLD